MRGTRNTDRNIRKFITIRDMDLWDKIDQIMTLPEYKNSFNKVINDALFFGLDLLIKSLFEVVEEETESETRVKLVRKRDNQQIHTLLIISRERLGTERQARERGNVRQRLLRRYAGLSRRL